MRLNFVKTLSSDNTQRMRKIAVGVFVCLLQGQGQTTGVYVTKSASGRMIYTNAPITGASELMFHARVVEPYSTRVAKVSVPKSRSKPIPDEVSNHIDSAAAAYDIEPSLISAVIRIESGFNRVAISPKGARGLMQLMPETAKRYGAVDLLDIRTNIFAGTAYLRDLLLMFDGRVDLALAGYNAGENAVRKYKNTIPPYPETKHYVSAVLAEYRRSMVER